MRSLERGYGSVFGNLGGEDGGDDDVDGEDMGAMRRWKRIQRDLWLEPKQATVARIVNRWWSRWAVLVILPAALVGCGLTSRGETWRKGRTSANSTDGNTGSSMVRFTIPAV